MSLSPTSTSNIVPRQLWAYPTPVESSSGGGCRNFTLHAGASLVYNATSTVKLSSDVVYQPQCSGPAFGSETGSSNDSVQQYDEPFYASVTPLVYVVAATTFVAWFLLIILFILPGGYVGVSGRRSTRNWRQGRGLLGVLTHKSSALGFGSRPWLQKIAAMLVVLALTTVTADTFKQARHQYRNGYTNAIELRKAVTYSTEVRVIRLVSDLFLWLAQIQTLIRLFPRHKEKLIIKWVGFLLICLDIIFSSLNSFTVSVRLEPRRYQDAIPALSYLFQLALSLLYGTWVIYYAITKRRYAFYHPLMPNICLIALFSFMSILVPVVFFLADILQPDVGAWGDYFRWVAAAAASIIVWEWVERIEALERDEKKDGILGREIFDEDEILDHSASEVSSRTSVDGDEGNGLRLPYMRLGSRLGNFGTNAGRKLGSVWHDALHKNVAPQLDEKRAVERTPRLSSQRYTSRRHDRHSVGTEITRPPPIASPVDRSEAASAGSTIYAVHYHPVTQTSPLALGPNENDHQSQRRSADADVGNENRTGHRRPHIRYLAANAFRKSRQSPPVEVKNILSPNGASESARQPTISSRRGVKSLAGLAPRRKDRGIGHDSAYTSEPTVIPAPPRAGGHAPWSPDNLRHTPLSEGDEPATIPDANEGVASHPQAALLPHNHDEQPTEPIDDGPIRETGHDSQSGGVEES